MSRKWMIDFDFDAYRKPISSEAMQEDDDASLRIIRDLLMSEFRFKCEQEIIRLRVKYEKRLNEII
jgi:hypothetical protein